MNSQRQITADHWIIAMLGAPGVGKTLLATQFTQDCFLDSGKSSFHSSHNELVDTCEAEATTSETDYRKQFIVDNRFCLVSVIHDADQEEYAALREQWIQEGQGFILVYSISDRTTFDRLEVLRHSIKGDPAALILVGNKSDQAYAREVSKPEGEARARELGCHFLETSAKTGHNVNRLFVTIARLLREAAAARVAATHSSEQNQKWTRTKSKCVIL